MGSPSVKGHCIPASQQTLLILSGPHRWAERAVPWDAGPGAPGGRPAHLPYGWSTYLPGTAPARPPTHVPAHTCPTRCPPFASPLRRRCAPGRVARPCVHWVGGFSVARARRPTARRTGSSTRKMRPGAACECDPHRGRRKGGPGRGKNCPLALEGTARLSQRVEPGPPSDLGSGKLETSPAEASRLGVRSRYSLQRFLRLPLPVPIGPVGVRGGGRRGISEWDSYLGSRYWVTTGPKEQRGGAGRVSCGGRAGDCRVALDGGGRQQGAASCRSDAPVAPPGALVGSEESATAPSS